MHSKENLEISQSVLEQIIDAMDEHMLSKAMAKVKKPEPEMPQQSESDDDFEVSQPVPMAEEKSEDDVDEDTLRQLIQQREQEIA